MPPIDNIQNVELLSSSEANGVTNLEFKRKLQACEPKDRSIEVRIYPRENNFLVVLWFYAPNFSDTYYVDLYDCC
jgi:hypothetical protein